MTNEQKQDGILLVVLGELGEVEIGSKIWGSDHNGEDDLIWNLRWNGTDALAYLGKEDSTYFWSYLSQDPIECALHLIEKNPEVRASLYLEIGLAMGRQQKER